jgi:hypothetical protein
MQEVINTRKAIEVEQCIYCGTTDNLTIEHVTPFGLSGRLELIGGSCTCCARMTSKIEDAVLGSMRAARAALKTKTGHSSRKKQQPMRVEKDGQILTKQAMLEDHWKVIRLPIFPPPAALNNRSYEGGIEVLSMDEIQLSEKMEDIAAAHKVDKILFPDYPWEKFARFIAKVAYGYAVAQYSLNAFEKVYVVPAILGETNDIGRWVGCSDIREFPPRNGVIVSGGFRIIPERDLLVKIKMFPMFDGAEYVVLVGKMKEIYAASYSD